jgi:amino acid transporter
MENAANFTDIHSDTAKVAEMRSGANWFFWVAILSLISSLVFWYYGFANHLVGLGINEYFYHQASATSNSGPIFALAMSFVFAAILAMFGYFARKGNDVLFILGAFLYFVDAIVLLGYREFFAFSFHIFALYFIFKGLLASRRRYDPSVDATGA